MARETLKSKHRASFYKSEEAWLNAIYRANKALIDAAYEGKGTRGPRAVFKSQVREYTAKGYGTKEHIEVIREVGPCPMHRKTFIGNFWDEKGKNSSANI